MDNDINLRPGANSGPRVEIDIEMGQTVNVPSLFNDKTSSIVLNEGKYKLHQDYDGGGQTDFLNSDIAVFDLTNRAIQLFDQLYGRAN